MKKYDILIFIQASADLRYALDIINRNNEKEIHLFVIHVKAIYKFLKMLNLEGITIDFQDYFNLKVSDIRTYFPVKNSLNNFWSQKFSGNTYVFVYFFSRFYDFHTASIVVKLTSTSNVYYYDHYDTVSIKNDVPVKKYSLEYFKLKYISLIVSFVSGANFINRYRKRYLEFNYTKYPIQEISINEKVSVSDQHKYHIKNDNILKNVVILLSPDELNMLTNEGKSKLKVILRYIKNKRYKLYLKGHPRLGEPMDFMSFFDEKVPSFVPSEFLFYKDFDIVLGIMSSGLVYPSQYVQNKVYSIINLLEFKNNEDKLFYGNFLKEHSKDKVKFLDQIEEF